MGMFGNDEEAESKIDETVKFEDDETGVKTTMEIKTTYSGDNAEVEQAVAAHKAGKQVGQEGDSQLSASDEQQLSAYEGDDSETRQSPSI